MKNAIAEIDDEGPRTNAEHREDATRRMMETATRLIAERGASKVALVDVGREAGYSHSLPTYYFKSKKRLLLEVYSFIIARARRRIRDWTKERAAERVRPGIGNVQATIRAYLGLAHTDPTGSRAMSILWSEAISSMPELLEVVRPQNAEFVSFFEQQIRIAIQRGEVDPSVDAESVALLVVSTLRGAVAQYMAEPERVNLERIAETIVELLNRSIVLPRKSD